MADTIISVFKNEKKYLVFTITDSSGVAVDCSNTTKTLTGGNAANASTYSVATGDFVTAQAASGILKALVTFSTAGTFDFLLKVTFTATGIIDEERFTVVVEDV